MAHPPREVKVVARSVTPHASPKWRFIERAELAKLLGALKPRVFMMRSPQDDVPVLMQTRWALSYLRGPLTREDIKRLTPGQAAASQREAPATSGHAGS